MFFFCVVVKRTDRNNHNNKVVGFNGSGTGPTGTGRGGIHFSSITNRRRRGRRLIRIIRFLGGPGGFAQLKTGVPSKILLRKPPNANGALLTGTITNRTNMPFFSVSNSSFIRVFIKINTDQIHSLFSRTGGTTPSVVFVSRVSTINQQHNSNVNNNRSRHRRALGRLLIRVSNFGNSRNIVIVTTAGQTSILSPTLLQPNHFSQGVLINTPSIGNHRTVLHIRTHGGPLKPSISLGRVTGRAPKFINTSLTGLLGRTTLLTTQHGRGRVSTTSISRTRSHMVTNPTGHSQIISPGRHRAITCRRTNRAVIKLILGSTQIIRGMAVMPHNHTNKCTVVLPHRSRVLVDGGGTRRRVTNLVNNQTTRRVVFRSRSSKTSGSFRRTARVTQTVIARCKVDSGVNPIRLRDSKRIFTNRNCSRTNCSRRATTLISRRVGQVLGRNRRRTLRVVRARHRRRGLVTRTLLGCRALGRGRVLDLCGAKGVPRTSIRTTRSRRRTTAFRRSGHTLRHHRARGMRSSRSGSTRSSRSSRAPSDSTSGSRGSRRSSRSSRTWLPVGEDIFSR